MTIIRLPSYCLDIPDSWNIDIRLRFTDEMSIIITECYGDIESAAQFLIEDEILQIKRAELRAALTRSGDES